MVPLPPYARRVEYLEVGLSGTFSVITDFTADTGYIEAKVEAYSTNSFNPNGTRWQYGFRKSGTANDDAHRLLLYTSTTYTGSSKRWDLGRGVSSPDSRILTTFPGVLNITKRWFNTSGREVPDKFKLFGTNVDPPDAIPLRFYYFRFYDPTGNTIVAEFIPCRILDKGYVFDTVSGKFYGNQGTGSFVLGSDVREGVIPMGMMPMGARNKSIRPYDAEVEWVEAGGSGTAQYIDTLVPVTIDTIIEAEWTQTDTAIQQRLFGVNDGGEKRFALYINYDGKWAVNTGTSAGGAMATVTRRDYVGSFNLGTGVCTINGTSRSNGGTPFSSTNTIPIFARRNAGTVIYSDYPATMRLKSFRIIQGGKAVFDAVSVRVGAAGYLYDRTNPAGGPLGNGLYGSATDIDLIAGPDKTIQS